MKKKLLTALSIALILIVGIVGTIAYLTDRDSEVNVFTMGDVNIELEEDFDQGSKLQPGKDIKKEVSIKNTGKNEAYVWYTFAVPANADDAIDAVCSEDGWAAPAKTGSVTVDGVAYNIYTCKYKTALAAGKETTVGMKTVTLSDSVDYNKNDGKYYSVVNGVATEIDLDLANTVIYVNAFGIQADGFADMEAAYNAYYTQWGTDNGSYPSVIRSANSSIALDDQTVVLVDRTEPLEVSGTGTVILDSANIAATDAGESALVIAEGANVKVSVVGENKFTGATNGNGIYVASGASLELTGEGTVKAVGNAGVEGEYANPDDNGGSGIGGEGAIYINGIDGLTADGYGKHAFGIGGSTKSVTIENTTITYARGGYAEDDMLNDSKYGKTEPEGGAAIGSSVDDAVITLNNVTIEKAEGGSKAAGIGAMYWAGVTININDSKIKEVIGGNASAGIGGSRVGNNNPQDNDININIADSTITAIGGRYGAGIGSGYDTYCHTPEFSPICTINITGDSVINATGGTYAAGVGTGYHAGGLDGKIESSVTVKAVSGEKLYKDTYTQAQDIGFGVIDPKRDGLNNTCSFDNQGTIITVPTVQ